MLNLRRTGPLMATLFVCLFVLALRLYEIQVTEHPVWAAEAARLSRHSEVVPHIRGEIRDRHGRVMVRDEEAYELEFVWRDFRREHPLGIVAQAWSLILGRPVTLEEARAGLLTLAPALVRLTPDQVRAFARGEAVEVGGVAVPPADQGANRERAARLLFRDARAADLRFYVHQLLEVSPRERRDLRALDRERWSGRTYLERLAHVREAYRGMEMGARLRDLEQQLAQRLARVLVHLEELARAVDQGLTEREVEARRERYGAGYDPLEALVADIERLRRDVEDATADRLFREACGFASSRLSPSNLRRLDLDWLRRTMQWDAARLEDWRVSQGDAFGEGAGLLAAYVFAQVKTDPRVHTTDEGRREVVEALLDCLAEPFFSQPRDPDRPLLAPAWRAGAELVVLGQLDEVLADGDRIDPERLRGVLAFEWVDPDGELRDEVDVVRAVFDDLRDVPPFNGVAEARSPTRGPARGPARGWEAHLNGLTALMESDRIEYGPRQLETIEGALLAWDDALQRRIGSVLDELGGPAAIEPGRIKSAQKERDHLIKDYSTRPRRLMTRPDHGLVQRISRFPRAHAGFHVRTVTRRVAVLRDEGRVQINGAPTTVEPLLLASGIVGKVRTPSLVHVLGGYEDRARRRRLESKPELTAEDEAALANLGQLEYHHHEKVGSVGIEAAFDADLTGSNGYRFTQDLTGQSDDDGPTYRAPVDGDDVWLTLHGDLQLHAQETLENPAFHDRPEVDHEWLDYPVGGIALIHVEGDVLVAASVPSRRFEEEVGMLEALSFKDDQRLQTVERIFRRPLGTPPGSTMKPLFAWWAMSRGMHAGGRPEGLWYLDPSNDAVVCDGGGKAAGFNQEIGCHSKHYEGVDLGRALLKSCNAYFGFWGARSSAPDFRAMLRAFGMMSPTGAWMREADRGDPVEAAVQRDRRGAALRHEDHQQTEDFWYGQGDDLTRRNRESIPNGLSVVNVSPAHLARAYAGLATGVLPDLRLVRRIGDTDAPAGRGHDLRTPVSDEPGEGGAGLKEAHRRLVCDLLVDVVQDRNGSAHGKGLDEADLGFRLAAKTGSADYAKADPRWQDARGTKMRKRTWLAGFFPAEDPQYVIVAYVHDTSVTASKSAAYLAAQFLDHDLVRDLVEHGPDWRRR